MAGGHRRRRELPESEPAFRGKSKYVKEEETMVVLDDEECRTEAEVTKLRGRWELASVLNFLNVFEPVIGNNLKLSAEEIEMGLIYPNTSLAELHVTLLKGIPPVSKTLKNSDTWVTVLRKKLATWWPWVAEGEIPLKASKGEEISGYKGLGSTERLLILKALCELRADQYDTALYISDALKQGMQISSLRTYKIGGDINGTSYWYDGNAIIGYRLYREVIMLDTKAKSKSKSKGKGCVKLPPISFQWETLATNLEEFREIADELKSSKLVAEAAVGRSVETDTIPVLENIEKKRERERERKRKQRQDRLLNDSKISCAAGVSRSCRSRRPVNYTFDDYDRAINEAIQFTKKGKSTNEQRQEGKHSNLGKSNIATRGAADKNFNSEDHSGRESINSMDDNANHADKKDDHLDSDAKGDILKGVHSNVDGSDYGDNKDDHMDSEAKYEMLKEVNSDEDECDYDGNKDYNMVRNTKDEMLEEVNSDDKENDYGGKKDDYMDADTKDEVLKEVNSEEDGNDYGANKDDHMDEMLKEVNSDEDDSDYGGNKYDDSMDSDTKCEMLKEVHSDDDDDSDYGGKEDDDYNKYSDLGDSEVHESNKKTGCVARENVEQKRYVGQRPVVGVRWSLRLAGASSHPVVENRSMRTKNRLRQRPTHNSALGTPVVPDSEDENSSNSSDSRESGA